ncbi:MAG TPA: D-glycero-beta-D-manno-heptose-7-phosphate kinase, partial [Gammaproteobacteria bacterium]|nr:D-glycero-beta-D-manno-heptose-7-phosphate kinase [Gammaproteobacteria bacterium]
MQPQIPEFAGLRILVAGDVMLDRYWSGATERISPEGPVPVVHVGEMEERPGGAANVAANLASLGVATTLLGLVGVDPEAGRLAKLTEALGIATRFIARAEAPTVAKLRVLSRHQQLLRLDFERGFDGAAADELADRFEAALAGCSIAVASDYAKGALGAITRMIAAARSAGLRLLIDPKGRDFDRYRGAWALTPNRAEFEAVAGACADDAELARRGEKLRASLDLAALLITRGEEGLTLVGAGEPVLHLPTAARDVADVTGAGDTVIAVFAAGLAEGLAAADAAKIANVAAGLVVAR